MDLEGYRRVLREQWLVVGATIILGLGAAIFITFSTSKVYTAVARVVVTIQGISTVSDLNSASSYLETSIETYASAAASDTILTAVTRKQRIVLAPNDLAQKVTVEREPDSFVLRISVVDDEPKRAAALANGVAIELSKSLPQLVGAPPSGRGGRVTVDPISNAAIPMAATSPNPPVNIVIGVLGGAILGLTLAVMRFRIKHGRPESRYHEE